MDGQKKEKRSVPILPVALCAVTLILLAIYAGGCFYFQSHFLNGTSIDGADVSGMTITQLEEQIQNYTLKILERQADGGTLEEEIAGSDFGFSYASAEPLEEILDRQNSWLWFLGGGGEHQTTELVTYDEDALEKCVRALQGFEKDFATAPTDAYIADYTETDGFVLVAETQGNTLDFQTVWAVVCTAVEALEEQVDLDAEGCYLMPDVTSGDEELLAAYEKLSAYAEITITYTFGENTEVLDGATICTWLKVDGFEVELDTEAVEDYVASLRKKYDTIFRSRTFQTSYGTEITIDGGDYGWWMNYVQEAQELAEMIENGESGERTPVYYQTAASYDTPDYGDTYVEINLTAQHLFFYQDGELILESDFVSGNPSKGNATPEGVYGITYKQRNATLVGETYETPVSYWMPFNQNIGLHDATWRSSFGGDIYKTNGSHGCINLPYSVAQELYSYVETGTPVICYNLAGTEPAEDVIEESITE